MSSKSEKQPIWNVWNKPNVKTARAAPVVLFDEASRKEYVTGFGKRKMQRKMIAQAAIKQQEKVERAKQRIARKKETEDYVAAITGAKAADVEGDGSFIGAGGNEEGSEKESKATESSKVGSKAVYETEDGGQVTTTVSAFESDSDSEEMPGLIPVSELNKEKKPLPHKPKLRGNTTSTNLSSSLNSKKRNGDHKDRKDFHKKSRR